MVADFSRQALSAFLNYVSQKGLVNGSTAQGWRVATAKVLDDLSPAELADIRRIDVETAFRKFVNKNPGRLSPASLGEYRRRVGTAIEEFINWAQDPASYRPRAAARESRAEIGRKPPRKALGRSGERPAPVPAEAAGPVMSAGLPLPFPIRPDFLAQVVVPRDLTVQEARRLGAFLLTLASDFEPANLGGSR